MDKVGEAPVSARQNPSMLLKSLSHYHWLILPPAFPTRFSMFFAVSFGSSSYLACCISGDQPGFLTASGSGCQGPAGCDIFSSG